MKKLTYILPVILLAVAMHFAYTSYSEKQSLEAYDKGAMSIVDKLVAGMNISYTDLSGQEWIIQLQSEKPEWFTNQDRQSVCVNCHKYSVEHQFLQKGGNRK